MKPYPAYKPTGLAWLPEVPQGWNMLRGKFLFTKMERPVRPQDEVVTCFRDGEVTLRKNRRLEGFTESLKEIGYQGVRKGDLVIHVMDAFAGSVGVSDSDGKSTPVYSVCVPKKSGVNNYYYAHIVRMMAKTGYIQSLYRGIRERSSDFRFEVFGNQFLPVPPPAEQAAIVAYLDEKTAKIDRLIELKEREIGLLNEKKQAVISKVVTRGLDPNAVLVDSGVDWIGKVPRGWKKRPLKRVLTSRMSGAWGEDAVGAQGSICLRIADFDYLHGTFKSTAPEDLTYRRYEPDEFVSLQLVEGDILVEKSGGGDKYPVGRAVIFDKNYSAVYANFMDRLRVDRTQVQPQFFLHWWRTMYSKSVSWMYIKQTTGIQNLDLADLLANEVIFYPSIKVQEKILSGIDQLIVPVDKAINAVTRQVALLKEYRTRLISDAVTGRIDLRKAVA